MREMIMQKCTHTRQTIKAILRLYQCITWSEKSEESKGRDDNAPPPAAPASEVGIISCVCMCVCVCVCVCVCLWREREGERGRERGRERGEREKEIDK